jgi:hypothetical protein
MSVDLHKDPQGNVCLIKNNSVIRPTFVNEMIIKIRQVIAMLYSVSETTLMSEMLLLVVHNIQCDQCSRSGEYNSNRKKASGLCTIDRATAANSTEFSDQVAVWPLKWYGSVMPEGAPL